jgi:hypothetical protein
MRVAVAALKASATMLSDEELQAVSALTFTMPQVGRAAFLQLLADKLATFSAQARGPGVAYLQPKR